MRSRTSAILRQVLAPQKGYILLIGIVLIGAIASLILTSLMLLGISSSHVSLSVEQASKALAASHGCAEYALLKLRQSPSYAGNETLTIGGDTCEVLPIGGIGNNNRLICSEGRSGDSVRRMEIVVGQVLPETTIYSWQEVSRFSLCF